MTERVQLLPTDYGACPLMSGVSAAAPAGTIALPNQQPAPMIAVVACIGDKCQWWSAQAKECGVMAGLRATFGEVAKLTTTVAVGLEALSASAGNLRHLANLEPPARGDSPMMRIADAVEKLGDKKAKQ